tara:strand:- start:1069 stop:1287 length:219 start_codon:yes stop_codon:yes gene_type:complete
MKNFTKKDLLLIINTYQNYMNDFVNVTDKDINNIYLEIAKKDLHATFYGKLDDEVKDELFVGNKKMTIISKR